MAPPNRTTRTGGNVPGRFWFALGLMAIIALTQSACQPIVAVRAIHSPAPTPIGFIAAPTASPSDSPAAASAFTLSGLWTFGTGAAVWGAPAVRDGTVYFGSDDGTLYAVDAQTGNLRWRFATQGIVRSQPAIAGTSVYFASDDGYLYAVDTQSGAQVWRTEIGNFVPRDKREKLGTSTDPTGFDYIQSSPVVAEGQVYIGSVDGNIYALSAESGKMVWAFRTGAKVRATPAVADGVLYIGSWDKCMYALDAHTGQLRWKTALAGEVQSTALVANGLVYTASRKGSVVALNAQTGEIEWEYAYGRNMWVESSPQLVGNVIYIGSSGYRPVIGLDSLTGKPFTLFLTSAFHWSTPAIVQDTLYIGVTSFKQDPVNKGGLIALKLVDGKIADVNRESAFFPVPEREAAEGNWSGVASSPIAQDGIIYFGGLDGKAYAVRPVP